MPKATWVLPVPLLPTAMTFSPALDEFTAGQLHHQGLVQRRDGGKSKVSGLFTAGKRAARIRRSTMRWRRSMSSSSASLSRYWG